MKQGRRPSSASGSRLPEILPAASKMALEAAYRRLLGPGPGVERALRKALTQALDPPGDLVRAQLALALQQRLAVDHQPAVELAVAIEAFHTASSLFEGRPTPSGDGLEPADSQPREMLTLAGLGLTHRGYALLWGALGELPPTRRRWAAQETAGCLGADGILGAQARARGLALGDSEVLSVTRSKSVPLVRLALVLPAIVAGVTTLEHGALERLAEAWGLVLQILDDFDDLEAITRDPGEGSEPGGSNLPRGIGVARALGILDRHLVTAAEALEDLGEVGSGIAPFHQQLGQRRLELGVRLEESGESGWRACAGG